MSDSPKLSTLISKTFSHQPATAKANEKVQPKGQAAALKPEASRDVVPLPTSAYVQALVWGNGPVPPVATPNGLVPSPQPAMAQADKPPGGQSVSPDQGTAGALDPVEKGWGEV